MDRAMGILGEGPCQRRLTELPILSLAFGAFNEASPDVHTLVALLAATRVQTLALQVGEGSGLAGNRRAWQRQEERRMQLQREADWLVDVSGQEVVRRGRFWR